MAVIEIPDIKFSISEDGELVNLEQGHMDICYMQLHKIQVKHIADLMKVNSNHESQDLSLTDYLERLRDDAEELCNLLSSVASFPPKAEKDKDVILAEKLLKRADMALAMCGVGY